MQVCNIKFGTLADMEYSLKFVFRYEKQLEHEEQAYQQQRRRLYTEVQEEKERLAAQIQKVKHETTQEKSASEVWHVIFLFVYLFNHLLIYQFFILLLKGLLPLKAFSNSL